MCARPLCSEEGSAGASVRALVMCPRSSLLLGATHSKRCKHNVSLLLIEHAEEFPCSSTQVGVCEVFIVIDNSFYAVFFNSVDVFYIFDVMNWIRRLWPDLFQLYGDTTARLSLLFDLPCKSKIFTN